METTIVLGLGFRVGVILGLYRDNREENGNYYVIIGLNWGYICMNM